MTADYEIKDHCDDYIYNPSQPDVLRRWVVLHRMPAVDKMLLRPVVKETAWVIYADYEGKRVALVMASRLGHVGFTYDLTKERGYEKCATLSKLSNFSEVP